MLIPTEALNTYLEMSKNVTRCQKKSTVTGFPFHYERIKRNPGAFRMSCKRLALRKKKRVEINEVKLFVPSGCTYGEPK